LILIAFNTAKFMYLSHPTKIVEDAQCESPIKLHHWSALDDKDTDLLSYKC